MAPSPLLEQDFLPFLPQDEAGGADSAAEEVVQLIGQDLQALLAASDADFWAAATGNASLAACLDSYLQNSRRPHDDGQEGAGPLSAARQLLSRNIYVVLLRIARAAGQHAGGGAALARRSLLVVPKLLDVAVLYGAANPALTRQLLAQALATAPDAAAELQQLAATTTRNLGDVVATCCGRVRPPAPLLQDVLEGLADGVVYLRDVCLTLAAFLSAAPAAAAHHLMVGTAEAGGLLAALQSVHDELVPALAAAAERPKSPAQPAAQMLRLLGHLQPAAAHAGALLLRFACLTAAQQPLKSAGGSSKGGGGTGGGFDAAADPVGRGELLLASLIALGQLFPKEQSVMPRHGQGGFMAALSARLQLPAAIAEAAANSALQLDDTQRDYLSALLGVPMPDAGTAAGASSADLAGAGPSSGFDAGTTAQIAQIREVLPDYGDGFLAAALQHFDGRPDRVINTLLEGSLPPELAALDPQAATLQRLPAPQRPAAVTSAATSAGTTSWRGLAAQAATAGTVPAGRAAPAPSAAAQSRKPHRATARTLDSARSGAERDAIRAAAAAAQWEYEDEYDDSFDAYDAGGAADGVADAEGDEDEALAGPRQRFGGAPPPRDAFGSGASATRSAVASASERQRQEQQPQRGQQQRQPGQQQPGQPQPAGRGQGRDRGGQQQGRAWVLDGKVYNYRKEGAAEVAGGPEAARRAAAAATAAAQAIHGLGPGGNVPSAAAPMPPPRRPLRIERPPEDGAQQGQQQQRGQQEGAATGRQRGRDGSAAAADAAGAASSAETDGPGRGSGGGRGRGGGRGGRGRGTGDGGGGAKDHLWKDQHKAQVANHHRKERAARKAGML